jgi:hypothetical protein
MVFVGFPLLFGFCLLSVASRCFPGRSPFFQKLEITFFAISVVVPVFPGAYWLRKAAISMACDVESH